MGGIDFVGEGLPCPSEAAEGAASCAPTMIKL